jgi:hypothetical protein
LVLIFSIRFTSEVIRKLFEYATKHPESNENKIGHKFPFNASEILCSETAYIIDKIFEETKIQIEDSDKDSGSEEDEDESSKGKEEIIAFNISEDSLEAEIGENHVDVSNTIQEKSEKEEEQEIISEITDTNKPTEVKETAQQNNCNTSPKKRKRNHHRNNADAEDIFKNENEILNISQESQTKTKEDNSTNEVKFYFLFFRMNVI